MIKELEIVKQSNEAIGASHPHYGGGKFATPTSSYNTMRPYQCHTISYHHTIIHKQLQYHATQDHTNEQTVHANAIQCHIKPTNVYLTLKQPQYHTIPDHTRPCMQNKPYQNHAVSCHIIPRIPFTTPHYQNQNNSVPYHTIPIPHKITLNPKSSTIPHHCLMVLLLLVLVRNNWKL